MNIHTWLNVCQEIQQCCIGNGTVGLWLEQSQAIIADGGSRKPTTVLRNTDEGVSIAEEVTDDGPAEFSTGMIEDPEWEGIRRRSLTGEESPLAVFRGSDSEVCQGVSVKITECSGPITDHSTSIGTSSLAANHPDFAKEDGVGIGEDGIGGLGVK